MRTTSKYGKPNAQKNIASVGGGLSGNNDVERRTMAGTEETEASAAMTAYRGTVGTTMLNRSTHTETQEWPIQFEFRLNVIG